MWYYVLLTYGLYVEVMVTVPSTVLSQTKVTTDLLIEKPGITSRQTHIHTHTNTHRLTDILIHRRTNRYRGQQTDTKTCTHRQTVQLHDRSLWVEEALVEFPSSRKQNYENAAAADCTDDGVMALMMMSMMMLKRRSWIIFTLNPYTCTEAWRTWRNWSFQQSPNS